MTKFELEPILKIYRQINSIQKSVFYSFLKFNHKLQIKNPDLANEMVNLLNQNIETEFNQL